MNFWHSTTAVGAVLLSAGLLTACGTESEARGDALPAFASIDQAYQAVDRVLDCEDNPVGAPIVPMGDGIALATKQRLCSDHVQVDLYADEGFLRESYEMWSDAHQGQVHIVRGQNWMVVDVTDVATGEPTTWDIAGLAEELGGDYTLAGPG